MNTSKLTDMFSGTMEIREHEPMKLHTTIRIGGPADIFCTPPSIETFCALLSFCIQENIPYFILGGGANLLVGDRGIRGVVISTELLTRYSITAAPPNASAEPRNAIVCAEAGLSIARLAENLAHESWSGFEFSASLPGTVGGAVYMNARCYNHEIADVLTRIHFFNPKTFATCSIERSQHSWEYKKTPFMPGGAYESSIILKAEFLVTQKNESEILKEMEHYTADRIAKGHFDYPSAGSMFKNNRAFGKPTGMILDELNFRGKRIGDAMVSPKHANIFVNAGNASARDMRALIELAQTEALQQFGFSLEPEVVFAGEF
ncbi:MAG TPA: UDP-N-acetylmuramate dehydrogenase [Spirochaetales bacterium]|nr:UDP-N-acetylmuramate dehydrogenase [Spirochaetales bacterium]HQG39391.1 UDP-N-acetylmuramate dehydrogenase [Spirochaetales bacterium]HQK33589.1 UDP-N-acetylmuramate dehydrogenase [Spirochaetales bacterium]